MRDRDEQFASRIITSTAKITTELTIQVPPNSSAMCTTALVSTSMKPAPRKNICTSAPAPSPARRDAARLQERRQQQRGDGRHDGRAAQARPPGIIGSRR